MDIQFCFDPFAVVTYICDYMMKSDEGLTTLFRQALKDTVHLNHQEKQNVLKTIYFTHRQVGASEALYRLIPSMHLQDSNITTCFVASGFPPRNSFLSKITEKDSEEEPEHDNEDCNIDYDLAGHEEATDFPSADKATSKNNQPAETVSIEGKPGKYKRSISIHEKY